MNGCTPAQCSPTALNHQNHPLHTNTAQQPFCAKASLRLCQPRGRQHEPHFIPQLLHPTWRHSYNTTYYSLMQPNVDVCVYTEKQGSVRREIGGRDGSICSLAIMREASDNIWVLNWYRLTKYPDQEERAAVLSCLYTMSALTAASCTVTI